VNPSTNKVELFLTGCDFLFCVIIGGELCDVDLYFVLNYLDIEGNKNTYL
jgi:hypothetical protein